jgi:DNA-directed RNA polymerase specialized sigma54-like protein
MKAQRLEQKQYQNLSPQQIQFLGLLQLPAVSLEKRIEEELEENPALDEDEQLEDTPSISNISTSRSNIEELHIEDKSESLENNLTKQLIDLNLEKNAVFLVNYLINSLDENGFFKQESVFYQ